MKKTKTFHAFKRILNVYVNLKETSIIKSSITKSKLKKEE